MAQAFPPIMNIPDYQAFVANTTIQTLMPRERWTVVTNKKKPIDMYSYLLHGRLEGAKWQDEYSLVTLEKLYQTFPTATNYTYFLDALMDGIVILDIEPTCPQELKEKMLRMDNILYAETSMSGKGVHLVFKLPKHILKKYPDAQGKIVFKDKEHGYYEILLSHYISFTGNLIELPEKDDTQTDVMVFEELFERMASEQRVAQRLSDEELDEIAEPETEYCAMLLEKLKTCGVYYENRPNIPRHDMSGYEYGFACHMYRQLYQLCNISYVKAEHTYTKSEMAWLIYEATKEVLPFRAKHEEYRNGLPWLLHVITSVLCTVDPTNNPTPNEKEETDD